jgi:hypothetical protein
MPGLTNDGGDVRNRLIAVVKAPAKKKPVKKAVKKKAGKKPARKPTGKKASRKR